MSEFNLEYRAPGELKPRERSYRTHSEAQIARLMASVRSYGFNQPVGIDIDNRIVAGMALVEVAKRLRMNRIPVVVLDHLNDGQLRAYAIAVNKIADQAGYDDAELALELADIRGFFGDVEIPEMGLTAVEIDKLIGLRHLDDDDSAKVAPESGAVICEAGDFWQMGRHRLLCGDALRGDTYDILMAGDRAQFVLSDLPYNLPAETISTTGRHGNFQQGSGELSSAEFTRFLTTAMRHMAAASSDGSIHMFFMSYHFLYELLRAGRIVYGDLKTLITWMKPFPGLGSWYRAQTEFVAAFKNGSAPFINNLGPKGRNRSTAWEYDGMAGFSAGRDELLAGHPTPKPIELLADAILDCTRRDGLVLDPFAGSGSLVLAAEQAGRIARIAEIDAAYCDVALRRFRKATGIEPVLTATGETLAEREARANEMGTETNIQKGD